MKFTALSAVACLTASLAQANDLSVLTVEIVDSGGCPTTTVGVGSTGVGGGVGVGYPVSLSIGGVGTASTNASIDLNGDGIADDVTFDSAAGAIMGSTQGGGAFVPFGHDLTATLSGFDADGDQWLTAAELDTAGVTLEGPSGSSPGSSLISDLYIGLVDLPEGPGFGGVMLDGTLFAVSLGTAEATVQGYSVAVLPAGPIQGGPPPPVACADTQINFCTWNCTPVGAACTTVDLQGVQGGQPGTCQNVKWRGTTTCGCVPDTPALSVWWLLSLGGALLLLASAATLRGSGVTST